MVLGGSGLPEGFDDDDEDDAEPPLRFELVAVGSSGRFTRFKEN